jgi:soluble lytic murein transglycosylase-like protein
VGWRPCRRRRSAIHTAAAALLGLVVAPAAAEVRLERLPDGTPVMSNPGAPRRVAAVSRSQPEIKGMIDAQAHRQGLDPKLVHAVVRVESSYDPTALSRKGAMGLMQLMPETARSLEVDDPYDPEQNLRGGTAYLRHLLDRFGGDLELALASYNAGPEAVDRYRGLPPYPETHDYVDRVLRLFRGEGLPAAAVRTRGRRTFLIRDAAGRLLLTTTPPPAR